MASELLSQSSLECPGRLPGGKFAVGNLARYLLLGLVLVAVAFVSALTAMRIAIHGYEVEVPAFTGMLPEDAESLALEHSLLVQVENRYYSPDIPEGRILSQSPQPGTRVRRGWRVRMAESMGPQHVVIPDVVGQGLRGAELNLRRRGLEPSSVTILRLSGLPPDQVVAQSPAANAVGIASPKVALLVTPPEKPPEYLMPNLVGSPVAEAVRKLELAGIRVRRSTPQTVALPAVLTASEPAAGVVVALNSEGESGAQSILAPVAASASVPEPNQGVVVSQSPPAGSKLGSASAVQLQVR